MIKVFSHRTFKTFSRSGMHWLYAHLHLMLSVTKMALQLWLKVIFNVGQYAENMICPSLFHELMSFRAVGTPVLLFKCYGFMDFLSACWTSAVTQRPTLSERGPGDSSPLSGPACKYSHSPAWMSKHLRGVECWVPTLSPRFPKKWL